MEEVKAKLAASEAAVKQFQQDRFGLTLQLGLYTLLAKTEWVMYSDNMPVEEYKALMAQFNPVKFNADEWAGIAKEAGMQSLLFMAKHHDGFSMYDSRLTEYKITNTPFRRDMIDELAQACRKYGIKLYFFYSLVDWYHPDYKRDWASYVAYYQGQVKEICTNYGKIGGILFDGWWPMHKLTIENDIFRPRGDWDLSGTYDMIHKLQPDAMVTNNHHILPLPGEDYQLFESVLPGDHASIPTLGQFNTVVGDKPLASWLQLSNQWCYSSYDKDEDFKSPEALLDILQKCAAKKCYLHLNVGPMPDGRLQPQEIKSLAGLGKLLNFGGQCQKVSV